MPHFMLTFKLLAISLSQVALCQAQQVVGFIAHNHHFCPDLSHLTVTISTLDYLFIFTVLNHDFDV